MNGFVRSTLVALVVGMVPTLGLAQCPGGRCGGAVNSGHYVQDGQIVHAGPYADCGGGCYRSGFGSRLFPAGGANIPRAQDVAYYLWDPCWPERYGAMAHASVNGHFCAQVRNGRVLHQTVWNWWFEPGTASLNPLGMTRLSSLARRRVPFDPVLYLQTAQDLSYNPKKPQELIVKRQELDQQRTAAIQQFLSAQTAGRSIPFQVVVHDPPEAGAPGLYPPGTLGTYHGQVVQQFSNSWTGTAIRFRQGGGGIGGGGIGGGGGGGVGGR